MRKTKYMIYVSESTMEDPVALFDAAIAHMIGKGHPINLRRNFVREYQRALTDELKIAVVNDWMQIRDAANFPFRNQPASAEGVEVDDMGTGTEDSIKEDASEDKGATGDVSVDDSAESSEKSGDASDGSDTGNGSGAKG